VRRITLPESWRGQTEVVKAEPAVLSGGGASAMPKEIDRKELQKLVQRGAQLVEVLPPDEFEEDHLPGAVSLPLRRLETEAVTVLDRSRPVIVYCWDTA
jgi:hypothetical protein